MAGLDYGSKYLLSNNTNKGLRIDNSRHNKPIVVYDLDWNKTEEYPSMKIASEKLETPVRVIRYKILKKVPLNNAFYLGYKPQF